MAKLQPVDEALADLDKVVDVDDDVVDVELEPLEEAVLVEAVDELEQRVFLNWRAACHCDYF